MIDRIIHLTFIALTLLFTIRTPSVSAPVSIDRILREHKVYIVTTEKEEDLSRYWLHWRPKSVETLFLSELHMKRNNLGDGGFVIYIIDRSKTRRLTQEEEKILPCPTSAIDPDEVIIYASKYGNKRDSSRQNKWDILISAPNEKWLYNELNRITDSGILGWALEERGTLLSGYKVKRLYIVSNEPKDLADTWVKAQSSPGTNAIDWEYMSIDDYYENAGMGLDLLFLINRKKISEKTQAAINELPGDLRDWLLDSSTFSERAVIKQPLINGQGDNRVVSAIVSPCQRHLQLAAAKYKSLNAFPQGLVREKLYDLSGYGEVVIVARPADRNSKDISPIVEDLAGKITATLGSGTGFRCVSRQDLKELIYESLLGEDGSLNPENTKELRSKLRTARALVVADLSALEVRTTYSAKDPNCITAPYPSFGIPEPSKPSRPDPDDRILFSGHKYRVVDGSRSNDPRYKADLKHYKDHELPQYERDLREWRYKRDDYEHSRYNHSMEWVVAVESAQVARFTGNLRVYDLGSFSVEDAGRIVFSCPLAGETTRQDTFKSDHVVVVGEHSRPNPPQVPQSHEGVIDRTIVSDAVWKACSQAVNRLLYESLVPQDKL